MKLPPHTKSKRGKVYYQRRVPTKLRDKAPFDRMPAVFEKAIKATDLTGILREVADLEEWFEHAIGVASGEAVTIVPRPSAAPTHSPSAAPALTDDWAIRKAQEHYADLVRQSVAAGRAMRSGYGPDFEAAEDWQLTTGANLNSQFEPLVDRDPDTVRRLALRLLAEDGLIAPLQPVSSIAGWRQRHAIEDSPAFQPFCQRLIDARLDALGNIQHRLAHNPKTYEPGTETIQLSGAPGENAKYDIRVIAKSLADAASPSAKTWKTRLTDTADLWVELGLPADVRLAQRTHVIEAVDSLLACPVNRRQRFPGRTIREAIQANTPDASGRRPYPCISPATVTDAYLAALSRIFSEAAYRELIDKTPVQRVQVSGAPKKGKGRGTRFEADELNLMFRLPLFVGCRSANNRREAGNYLSDDHWFWAPLVALFTGARTTELAQLLVSEVKLDSETPHFIIQPDSDRSLKTDAAERLVPIHDELFKIGFREYVERQVEAGQTRLFPGWECPNGKKYADSASQRHFRRYTIPAACNRSGRRPVFHSFRHTLKNAMAGSRIPPQHQNAILGHEQEGMDGTYLADGLDLHSLTESMREVRIKGLDLSHLHGTRTAARDTVRTAD